MRYCKNCVLPDTRPHLELDADSICNACRTHRYRPVIDWGEREAAFGRLVDQTRRKARSFDCVIPVSGGKDSTWQTVKCLEYGLRPLAVTWKTPARTAIGQRNLENLVSLGVDHIDWQVNPKVEARFMLKTFERCGSTAVPMHLALFAIPLNVAARFGIPLIVWGENSAVEYGSASKLHEGHKLNAEWLRTYGVTHGTTAADWVDNDLSEKDLASYFGPDPDQLEAHGVHAVFLGHFFQWEPETSYAVAREHGFKSGDSVRTGYYDFADIDDDFISIHHWMKWYKFGFTRLFDNLSLEIRNGRLTREQAVGIIREAGDQTPKDDIRKFCSFAGVDVVEFMRIAERFRNPAVWTRHGGTWKMRDFLISDWNWNEADAH